MHHSPVRPRPPGRRDPRRTAGFTILEVALASFVMALGLSTSIVAMQSGFKFLDVARDTTLASQILQSEIERIRMMSWTDITGGVKLPAHETFHPRAMFDADPNSSRPADPDLLRLADRFTVTRDITADSTRPNDVRFITLDVAWVSIDGRPQTRRFQTKYVKNGLYDYYYTLAGPPLPPPSH